MYQNDFEWIYPESFLFVNSNLLLEQGGVWMIS